MIFPYEILHVGFLSHVSETQDAVAGALSPEGTWPSESSSFKVIPLEIPYEKPWFLKGCVVWGMGLDY